jgi:hypothetical protein
MEKTVQNIRDQLRHVGLNTDIFVSFSVPIGRLKKYSDLAYYLGLRKYL